MVCSNHAGMIVRFCPVCEGGKYSAEICWFRPCIALLPGPFSQRGAGKYSIHCRCEIFMEFHGFGGRGLLASLAVSCCVSL